MKSVLERVLPIVIIFTMMLVPVATRPGLTDENVIPNCTITNYSQSASYTEFSITEVWSEIWDHVSSDRIKNYTRILSTDYPDRVWDTEDMVPSVALEEAWDWANETLKHITDETGAFHLKTDYQILVAVKGGVGPSPRTGLVVTGIIDSGFSPGANSGAGSVAAVLEIANVLHEYSLAFDVYYVLINRGYNETEYDLGSRAFVSWLDENRISTLTTIAFERILYGFIEQTYRNTTAVRTAKISNRYQDTDWLLHLLIHVSSTMGPGRLRQASDLGITEHSCAYEMWRVGRPAVHVAQGFWPDHVSGTDLDTWDNEDYNYGKASEAVASVISVIVYLGMLGKSEIGIFSSYSIVNALDSIDQQFVVSSRNYLNTTITWNNETTIEAQVVDTISDEIVYERTEDDKLIVMKYLTRRPGRYYIRVTNLGINSTAIEMNVTFVEDCDGDGLSDLFELDFGTNMYSSDTDFDGLDDDFELEYGSDPTAADSDGDGALDLEEYISGSSLILVDSDGDGILDGVEYNIGTDPTDIDSDDDGLTDYQELEEFNTNPLSSDTDADGLEDGFETEAGLNPLSPDSDGDGLSDLFEILNQIDPLSPDTDGDGWGDSYEVEFCLSPTDTDTDNDGIPDGIDWDPRDHWLNAIAPVSLISIILMLIVFSFMKYRLYQKPD
jgi:hypothetical protein